MSLRFKMASNDEHDCDTTGGQMGQALQKGTKSLGWNVDVFIESEGCVMSVSGRS